MLLVPEDLKERIREHVRSLKSNGDPYRPDNYLLFKESIEHPPAGDRLRSIG